MRKPIVLAGIQLLFFATVGAADALPSIDVLAHAMAASRESITDISYSYELQEPTTLANGKPGPMRKEQGDYQSKPSLGLKVLSLKQFSLSPDLKTSTLENDDLVAFNGEQTRRLRRILSHGYMRGWIFPGKLDDAFPIDQYAPDMMIWHHGRHPFDELMTRANISAKVISSESLRGVNTFHVVLDDGASVLNIWVAPSRDYLPVQTIATRKNDNRILQWHQLDSLVQLENGAWYPTEIRYDWGEDTGIGRSVKLKHVSSAPVPLSAFTPSFPDNTRVVDQIANVAYFAGGATEAEKLENMTPIDGISKKARANELDSLVLRADSQLGAMPPGQTSGSATSPPALRAWVVGIAIIASVIGVVIGILWRKRSSPEQ